MFKLFGSLCLFVTLGQRSLVQQRVYPLFNLGSVSLHLLSRGFLQLRLRAISPVLPPDISRLPPHNVVRGLDCRWTAFSFHFTRC